MKLQKLFVATYDGNERVYFDADGRIYEFNLYCNGYTPTTDFVYEQFVCRPILIQAPVYVPVRTYAPEMDFSYEIIN